MTKHIALETASRQDLHCDETTEGAKSHRDGDEYAGEVDGVQVVSAWSCGCLGSTFEVLLRSQELLGCLEAPLFEACVHYFLVFSKVHA